MADLRATTKALTAAHEALDADQPAQALEHLLDAWRATRLPAIAKLIDDLSARITANLAPVDDALEARDFHEAWMQMAHAARTVDIPLLAPGLMRGPMGAMLVERGRHMLGRPADPRIAAALVGMLADPPATANSNVRPMWEPMCESLVAMGDTRGRKPLEARLATKPPTKAQFWGTLYGLIEALLDELPKKAPIEAAERRAG